MQEERRTMPTLSTALGATLDDRLAALLVTLPLLGALLGWRRLSAAA